MWREDSPETFLLRNMGLSAWLRTWSAILYLRRKMSTIQFLLATRKNSSGSKRAKRGWTALAKIVGWPKTLRKILNSFYEQRFSRKVKIFISVAIPLFLCKSKNCVIVSFIDILRFLKNNYKTTLTAFIINFISYITWNFNYVIYFT